MLIGYLIAAILAGLALTRLPTAVRGRNVLVMLSAASIVIAFALITPGIYGALDRLSPVPNLVDLIAKLFLFTGLLLAGTQVARAWNATDAQRWISGIPGTAVFFLIFAAEVVIFGLVHDGGRAPDLTNELSNPLVRVYSTLATAYPAYLAALLLPRVRQGLTSTQRSIRATSLLLFAGFSLAAIRFVVGLITLLIPSAYFPGQIMSGVAAIFVALGLATALFARVSRQRRVRRRYN